MKVVKIDKAATDYYIKLTNLQSEYRRIGVNYNQAVKTLHTGLSEKKALAMLYKLEQLTIELISEPGDYPSHPRIRTMVAKITSGASVYGALYYNHEKVDKRQARALA